MSRMKKLQPEMERLKTRFADDKQQQQEMMELYKRGEDQSGRPAACRC